MENNKRKHCKAYQVHIQLYLRSVTLMFDLVVSSRCLIVSDFLSSHIKSYTCPFLVCAEDCCQKGVSFSVVCRSPDMTAKISENEIKPDVCAIPKGQRTWFHLEQNTLIHSISNLPRLSKSVLVFVRSGKKKRCTKSWWLAGLSRRKLVLTKEISNNLHLAKTENKSKKGQKRKKRR